MHWSMMRYCIGFPPERWYEICDGSPTTLTERVYDNLWDGKNLTPQQRLEIYGRRLAELTEYWRAHRRVAGVLHFCGLGYSRSKEPRGQTSDHFIDIRRLTFEPSFYKYVKPAFAPVGLMIDTWEKEYTGGSKISVPVFVINDLEQPFNQEIQLSILQGDQVVSTYKKTVSVKPFEVLTVTFEVDIPAQAGVYLMKGEYTQNNENVFCLRDIPVRTITVASCSFPNYHTDDPRNEASKGAGWFVFI